ncbi:MAG TPA: hypothetical protein VIV57_20540 [Anaeromyxobacter sp.]
MRAFGGHLGWLVLLGAWLAPAAVPAQVDGDPAQATCPGCARMGGPGGPGGRRFDPKAVTLIQGEVADVQRVARGRHEGIHLTVAMGSENVIVHLGPAFYVDGQDLKLAKGDRIEVKGARTTFDGQPVILAQEVRRGEQVLTLRDANGVPLWRGQGMGRR